MTRDYNTTIYPTNTCFDDALDLMQELVIKRGGKQVDSIRLVHAICLIPDGHDEAGQRFAHAWLEENNEVIAAGILQGIKIAYKIPKDDHYAMMRVQYSKKYTVLETLNENWASNHYGPWDDEIRKYCKGEPN